MEKTLLIYSIQVAIGLLIFYALYLWFFKNNTFFKAKRWYFIFVIVFCLFFPCIKLVYPIKSSFFAAEYFLPVVEINASNTNLASPNNLLFIVDMPTTLTYLFIAISLIGSFLLSVRMILQLIEIYRIKNKNRLEEKTNYSLIYVTSPEISSFSFFNWVFIPDALKSDKQINDVLLHESAHVNQMHSIDIIISEVLCILFWWNPLVWQIRKEMKLNLEYLADSEVLNQGVDPTYYQYLLLQITNKNASIQLINNFNVSQLKKRIVMMNKEKTSKNNLFRYLLVVPIVVAATWFGSLYAESPSMVFDAKEINVQDDDKPFDFVDQMPQFPGGELAMMNYIGQNLKYPEDAIKDQVEGRIVIRFVITKDGDITDVQAIRSLSPSCDAEAIRVVKAMPQWTPGKQNGRNVSVFYTLPILYKMQKNSDAN